MSKKEKQKLEDEEFAKLMAEVGVSDNSQASAQTKQKSAAAAAAEAKLAAASRLTGTSANLRPVPRRGPGS